MSKIKLRMPQLDTWFVLMGLLLFAYQVFTVGLYTSSNEILDAIGQGILAVFWLGFLAIMALNYISRKNGEIAEKNHELEVQERLFESFVDDQKSFLDKITSELRGDHQDELARMLVAIIKDVTGGEKLPSPDQISKIEAAFHENTDHYCRLEVVEGGMQAEVRRRPFDDEPSEKPITTTTTTTETSKTSARKTKKV